MKSINDVLTYVDNGEFWFSLKDVCDKFDMTKSYDRILEGISDWQKRIKDVEIDKDIVKMVFTNEAGLYQVAMFARSDNDHLQKEMYDRISNVRKDLYALTSSSKAYINPSKYKDTHTTSENKLILEKLDRILNLLENDNRVKSLEKQIDSLTVMLNNTIKESDRIKRKFKDYRDSIINKGKHRHESESEKDSDRCCATENPPINSNSIEKSDDKGSCCCNSTIKNDEKSDDIADPISSLFENIIKMYSKDIDKISDMLKSEK